MKFGFANLENAASAVARRLMWTESEWNPKVILGRTAAAVLPERILHGLKKTYYGFLISHQGEDWQETDARLLKYLVHPGDVAIDVGASIGGFTKLLSDIVGPSGYVYAFEPNPPTYDFLSHNVKKLKLRNVKLFRLALSESCGTATMVTPRYRWGSECHYDATLEHDRAESGYRRTEISLSTLDSIFADQGQAITFIKCDVNYHELAFLRGGLHTISRLRPALLIEILGNPDKVGSPAAQVFELLQQNGYTGFCFDGERLRRRQCGERSQNYFFLTPAHIKRIPECIAGRFETP